MKYNSGGKYVFTAGMFKGRAVIPFDGEITDLAPWCHGFTCYKDAATLEYIGWCGTQYFEDNTIIYKDAT